MARFLGGGDDGDARNANDDGDSALRPCGQPHTALLLLSELVEPKAKTPGTKAKAAIRTQG
jgi:hypothetical protein